MEQSEILLRQNQGTPFTTEQVDANWQELNARTSHDEDGYNSIAELAAKIKAIEANNQDIDPDSRYSTMAALIADQNNQVDGEICFVLDASGHPNITAGYAYFEYLGTTNGDETDYRIQSKEEDKEGTAGGDSYFYQLFSANDTNTRPNWWDATGGDSGTTDLLTAISDGDITNAEFDRFIAPFDCEIVCLDIIKPDDFSYPGAGAFIGLGKHQKNPATIDSVLNPVILKDEFALSDKVSFRYGVWKITSFDSVSIAAGESVVFLYKGQIRRLNVALTFKKV